MLLFMRNRKFTEFSDLIGGVSSRTLTDKLRMLEKAGYLERRIISEAPVKIQYSLTNKGRGIAISLFPLIHQIKKNGGS